MEFSTVWRAFVDMLAFFGPFLLPMASLYWLTMALKLWDTWDAHRDTDDIISYLIGGLAMVYLAVDYSVGVIRAPESSMLQDFAVIVTGCCVLIFLREAYMRARAFIKVRRTSN